MNVRFEELMAQVRLAKRLGFAGIAKSCHYSSSPWREIQQIPFLARAAAEAPGLTFLTSIVLLPLHKPLEIAEQTAALDLFTGGRFILGVGIGYRDVEFKAFGTSQKERVPRLVENIQAIRRLWTEDAVTMKGSHFELDGAVCSLKPRKPPPIWIGANADPAIRRAAHIADSWMINPHNRIDTILRQIGGVQAGPRRSRQALARDIAAGARDVRGSHPCRGDPACASLSRSQIQGVRQLGTRCRNAGRRQRSRPRSSTSLPAIASFSVPRTRLPNRSCA